MSVDVKPSFPTSLPELIDDLSLLNPQQDHNTRAVRLEYCDCKLITMIIT